MDKKSSFQYKLHKTMKNNITIMLVAMIALLVLIMGLLWEMNSMQKQNMQLVQLTKEARENNVRSQVAMYKRCLSKSEEEGKKYLAEADSYDVKLQENLKTLLVSRPSMKSNVVQIQKLIQEAFPKKSTAVLLSAKQGSDDVAKYLEINYFPIMTSIDLSLEKMNTKITNDIDQRAALFFVLACTIGALVAAFVLVCIIVASKRTKRIQGMVAEPLYEIRYTMEQLAAGNLHSEIKYYSEDEFGEMLDLARNMQEELKKYIENIDYVLSEISIGNMAVEIEIEYQGSFDGIKDSMQRIKTNLAKMMGTIEGTASVVQKNAAEFYHMSDELELSSGKQDNYVKNLNHMSKQIKDRVEESVLHTNEVNKHAEQSREIVEDEKKSMKELLSILKHMQDSSVKISNIMDVIHDIADQTKVLSLNAQIEAARVGEEGKGFSVVAMQISELAEEIAIESKEIHTVISENVSLTKQSNETIRYVAELLNQVGNSTLVMSDGTRQVADEIHKQGEEIEFFDQVVGRIAKIAIENNQTALHVKESSGKLKLRSEEMGELLAGFGKNRV